MKFKLASLALAAAVSSAPVVASAYSEGISGRAVSGCLGIIPACHNDTMGRRDGAMVAIEGPMSVAAGSRTTFTLRVARTDMGTLGGGGLDVIASGGALRANAPNTRLTGCELTHSALIVPAMMGATELRIPFDFIAPASSTTVTLSAAGNAVDGNGLIRGMPGQTGDQWGTATLAVTVTGVSDGGGVCPDPSDVVVADAADASDVADVVTDEIAPLPDVVAPDGADGSVNDTGSESGPPRPGCACRAGATNGARDNAPFAIAALALGLAGRRRRRARAVRASEG
jgi:MYXO-CTERM domain-containing protein